MTMTMQQAGTVLVVENDATLRQLLDDVLSGEGYRVLRATDGEQGLRLAEHHQPDAILLDVGFPAAVEAAVLARLKRGNATAHLPVIALTAQPSLIDGDGLQPDAWIPMPFEIEVLVDLVGGMASPSARSRTPAARGDRLRSTATVGGV